jgi:hypothetical protein
MDRIGVRTSLILTGETGAKFKELSARYAGAHPGRFVMGAGMEKEGIEAADYGERLRRAVRADVAAGAVALGELHDKGRGLVRVGERAYFIDDARFDPLWDEAGRVGLPVFVHIAEPAAFYDAPDGKNELRRSGNWSLYKKGTPGFSALIEKFEHVLSRHPNTRFVAVHAFNLANDLGQIGATPRPPSERPGRLRRAHVGACAPAVLGATVLRQVREPDPLRDRQRPDFRHVRRARPAARDRGRVVLAGGRGVVARLRNESRARDPAKDLRRERRYAPAPAAGPLNRRHFFRLGAAGAGAAAVPDALSAFVPAHRWDGYEWGTAPPVPDRLNQGPFPQYPPEEVLPGSEVGMATTPSRDIVPGYGMGLITYVTGDFGAATFRGLDMEKEIDALAAIPMGQKLYVRPTLCAAAEETRPARPGRVLEGDFRRGEAVRKRVGFRVMMGSPDIAGPGAPGFRPRARPDGPTPGGVEAGPDAEGARQPQFYEEPRYDHPSLPGGLPGN